MKKKFTQDEVKFLYEVLKNLIESDSGCQIPGTDIKCPYWKSSDGDEAPGHCTVKKADRVCTKLELSLVDEELILEVRQKKTDDYIEELDRELKLCRDQATLVTRSIRELNSDRQHLQETIDRLEKKKILLDNKESRNESTSRTNNTDD